jgi:hypothetical protein
MEEGRAAGRGGNASKNKESLNGTHLILSESRHRSLHFCKLCFGFSREGSRDGVEDFEFSNVLNLS